MLAKSTYSAATFKAGLEESRRGEGENLPEKRGGFLYNQRQEEQRPSLRPQTCTGLILTMAITGLYYTPRGQIPVLWLSLRDKEQRP